MKYLILVCLLSSLISSKNRTAQNTVKISLEFQNDHLTIDSSYSYLDSASTIEISRLKFYISNLSLWNDSMNVYDFPEKYYLIDINNLSSLNIDFNVAKSINCPGAWFDPSAR